jgi:hypothetical protein
MRRPRNGPFYYGDFMKLKFNLDGYYNGVHKYIKGQVYDIPDTEAVRWLRRGAEEVIEIEPEVKEEIKEEIREEKKEPIVIPQAKVNNKGRKTKSAKA